MSTFIADKTEVEAFDIRLKQEGVLTLQTRIDILGNHHKGPVPVSIHYEASFQPDEQYWERDVDYPDEEPYPKWYLKNFETKEERDYYIIDKFSL